MKTWLTAVFCCTRAILFPRTKIVIASGTKGQSREVIEKIDDLRKSQPNLDREILDLKTTTNDARVEFHNGSWIKIVASNDGARSKRANLLIIDEFRMVNLDVITKVLRKFLTAPRDPKFLEKEEYAHLKERNKEIYLSSCWYKHHWSYKRFLSYVKAMIKGSKYFVCGLPYQISVKEGILDADQVLDEMSEDDFDEIAWLIEMGAMWYGESEKAYFKFEDLDKNRKIATALYPSESQSLLKEIKPEPKKPGELRLISNDIAVMAGKNNDSSVYSVYRLIPNGEHYIRSLVYMESINGGNTLEQAIRIRQLHDDFEADYIVIDGHSVGTSVYDAMVLPLYDKERGKTYEPISCKNDEAMAERCTYKNAPKVVYSIKSTKSLNSQIAVSFRDAFRRGKIKLLTNELDAREIYKKSKEFMNLSAEQQAKVLSPHAQMSALINEMINLEAEFNDNGEVTLHEPSSKRKDRYSSTSYGNFVADMLEREYLRKEQTFDDIEDDELIYY